MTLIEFLNARLDDDERVARAAADAAEHQKWDAFGYEDIASVGAEHPDHPDGEEWYLLGGNLFRQSGDRSLVEHVARHDPARVLRETAAKRAFLRAHPFESYADEPAEGFCGECQRGGAAGVWPCPTMRHLATIYSDHPDYQQEWKVT